MKNTENTNGVPQGTRSIPLTVNLSRAQLDAVSALAGDRGITPADAVLLLAFAKLNTYGSYAAESDWLDGISEVVLDEGLASVEAPGDPLPYEADDAKGCEKAPPGTVYEVRHLGRPLGDDGEAWKQG